MKTVKDFLEKLDEPYRSQALANCKTPNVEVENLFEAVGCAFLWSSTEQGQEYWQSLHSKIGNENENN